MTSVAGRRGLTGMPVVGKPILKGITATASSRPRSVANSVASSDRSPRLVSRSMRSGIWLRGCIAISPNVACRLMR